jgi:pimeloyl-ACP methyl ester carboxylesterase
MSPPEPYEIRIPDETVADLRGRLGRARWPAQPADQGWLLGTDLAYTEDLCGHWRERYDFSRLERLNSLGSERWEGLQFLHLKPEAKGAIPVVMLHGWPSGPIEYERAAQLVADTGREVVVPSLPGFAWSEDPGEALNATGMASRLLALLADGLGLDSFVVAGGDWGTMIAARMAFDAPERVTALYVSTPGVLPRPAELADPPLSEAELAFAERAQRWLRREGHHMIIQSAAPDVISAALLDSPSGLAAYLVEKYRRWSDSDGDVERRFAKDDLCDFLTMFWSTGCIGSSMRLYYGERVDRWRLGPGERIDVPAGVGAFHAGMRAQDGEAAGMLGNPPREWTERILADLRHWSEPPTGAHFSAFEEPELYAQDLLKFLDEI